MTLYPSSILSSDVLGESQKESSSSSQGLSARPVIARLAGLPAKVLEPLTSPSCIALLQARDSLEEELREARQSIVETLGDVLPGFDAATRRLLLAVKRDCFNGRSIERYRGKAEWNELLRVSPNLPGRILALEEQLLESDRTLTALYEHELTRERRHILDLIQDCRFLRGVALGRLGLVQKVRARAPSLLRSDSLKKPEKWEQSLLRFITRAAVKLSANSTLTTYALGSIHASPSPVSFHFVGFPQREISLVRLDRPEIEQLQALLVRHPSVRERSLIAWNDSVEELETGQYRFLRGGYWNLEPGTEGFQFVRPARITVRLSNALVDAAREALGGGALRYDRLLARLEDEPKISVGKAHDPQNRSDLDHLIDLGILILMPPWPAYEARLEQRIGQFLRTLPNEPSLTATTAALDETLKLEERFASDPQPERSVARMKEAFSRLLNTVVHLAGHEGPLTIRAHFFEDVLVAPMLSSEEKPEIFEIANSTVQDILQSASLVLRFAGLFNHRHDILHTLAVWWRDHEPHRREAPFLKIAQGFAPIWKQFIQFHKTANQSALNTFNPLSIPAIERLRERRETLLSQYAELLSKSPTKDILPAKQLEELLEALPRRYAPFLGPCVFVQPIDAEGTTWVLNHLHEGTGRYLSRVTPVLEGPLQQLYLNQLMERSAVTIEGEEAELLEVMNPKDNLVNAHPPQAAKVLDLRNIYLGLPQERTVSLADLTVHADLESETFRLIGPSGRRVLPANLSTLADIWHPNLLRFLLMFGPGETRGVFPSAHSDGDEHFRFFNRLTCGKLVLRRQRWVINIESLRNALESLSDYRAYTCIQAWRRRLSLPSTGFYSERTYHGGVKPQYVDFGSPALCSLFVSSLRKMTGDLILEEALPQPANFPFDASMNRRGIEFLIDSLAIRTVGGIPPLGY